MPSVREIYHFDELTWPEVNEAVAIGKIPILPVGSVEQHGHHLPLKVDHLCASAVATEAARLRPDISLVLPPVSYGYVHHVMDFPGSLNIHFEHFIQFCLDICKSLAYHGFKKIVIVNGHGSNAPLIDLVARKTVLSTESLCFATTYFWFLLEAFEKVRESKVIAHADEFETSLYLHLAADRVQMEKAVEDNDRMGKFVSSDSTSNYFVRFNDYWGRWTKTGVHGDPTKATAEIGKQAIEFAAVAAQVRRIEHWAKDLLHIANVLTDADLGAGFELDVRRARQMVGVRVGLEHPVDGKAFGLCRLEDAVGRFGRGPAARVVVVEHGIDDRGALCLGVSHEVAHGVGGLVEEGFDDGARAHGNVPFSTKTAISIDIYISST